jgi:uncharacterized protein with PQ loop repeat
MGGDSVAANVLGTIGTVFWCIQLIPQIAYNWKRKDCTGLPPIMMFLWAVCGVPFAIYFVSQGSNIPIQIQPHLFYFFAGICWAQSLYYPPRNWPLRKTLIALTGTFVSFAGVECAFIFPLRSLQVDWPITLMGVLDAILLAAGLIPPYFELSKRQGQVVGINFIFLAMDSLGALFSLFSLVAENKGPDIDILGCVLYAVVLILEIGIFSSHIIWTIRFRKHLPLDEEPPQSPLSTKNTD